jgi:D-sedoheptulose 7-phosphate isomerase
VESYKQYALQLRAVIDGLPLEDLKRIADALFEAYRQDRTVFVFGNGGSAALASHLACDLGKGITPWEAQPEGAEQARRLRVMSLTDNVPMISAWANDASYEDVFVGQMENFLRAGDVAFAISGSGNSPNVLKALRLARQKQATTMGFSGQGGKMVELLDCPAVVPSAHMQLIEDAHLIMMHMVFLDLKARLTVAQAH